MQKIRYIQTLIEKYGAEIDHFILLLALIYKVISTDILILIMVDSVLAWRVGLERLDCYSVDLVTRWAIHLQ